MRLRITIPSVISDAAWPDLIFKSLNSVQVYVHVSIMYFILTLTNCSVVALK